jgi:hypothetical protein
MVVTFMALAWTALMWASPEYFYPPMPALSAAALALFFAKTLKTLLLYPQKVRSGMKGAMMASIAGLSLTHTVGKAVLAGIFTSGKPFLRTPKCEDQALLSQALRIVWQEATLFGFCVLAVVSVGFNHGFDDPAAGLWMVMLTVQGLPYAATVATAAVSALSNTWRKPAETEAMAPVPEEPVLSKAA